MNVRKYSSATLVSVFIATAMLGLSACEKKGPIEQVAEEVDEAVEDVKNGGETIGNKLDDAVDEIRE